MRLQNARDSATPGPSNTGPQSVSTAQVSEDGSSLATQTQSCSSTVERPKPRPIGKEKANAAEIGTTSESQIMSNESTTMSMAPRSMPKPRPITRAKGKSATVEKASTSLENVPESGVATSDNMQNTQRRGSKRGNITQLDEAPVRKKRKTQTPKPASPASEPVIPALATASLPQSADSTSAATDADEVTQDEHDPAPTPKRTLRKHKRATTTTTIEDAGVPVKRLRGKTRK